MSYEIKTNLYGEPSIELLVPGGKRVIVITLYDNIRSCDVVITNSASTLVTKFSADLSGDNGEVAAFRIEAASNAFYQLPKWVRKIIKKELNKTA